MNHAYPSILIIYNPTSTSGRAQPKAIRLTRQLKRRQIQNVKLRKSEYAGHAEELAYQEVIENRHPLIISVSGDGGYNEVINGAMRAQLETKGEARPVCAIFPAGNANDHRRAVRRGPLLKAILENKPEPMDILCLEFRKSQRFAHSYIGIGITAETVADLNVESLSRWKEFKIVTRNLLNFNPVTAVIDGKRRKIDSLVFANINRIAKYVKISKSTNLQSGKYSLVLIPHRTRLKFLYLLAKIAIFGVKNPLEIDTFSLQLLRPELAQLDGEPIALPAKTNIRITAQPNLLKTLR